MHELDPNNPQKQRGNSGKLEGLRWTAWCG